MTRERRIAIQQWQEIEDKIGHSIFNMYDILAYKNKFVTKHLGWRYWRNNCYMCQYMLRAYEFANMCVRCPLYKADRRKDCCSNSYQKLENALQRNDYDSAKEYARRIKHVLEGKVK